MAHRSPMLEEPPPQDAFHAELLQLNGTVHDMDKLKACAAALPYSIEPNSRMQRMLDFFVTRIVQCVRAKDYDPGFLQWESMLAYWLMLKYPMPKEKRIRLARLYFELCVTPGLPTHILATCCEGLSVLTRSKKKLSVKDLRLSWKPVYRILSKDLFLSRRQFEISQTTYYMGQVAETARRFFHPATIDEMLATFVPPLNGSDLNIILASQYYLLTFLPLSHPQSYLPMLFRLWESVNSYMYDERMLAFLSQLAEMHVDPTKSDPRLVDEIPDDAIGDGESRVRFDQSDLKSPYLWTGITKDVGIFTEEEWKLIMCKCLASMEIPLADSGSLTTGPSVDGQAGFEIGRLPKPTWRIFSLARIIVYSMAQDGLPLAPSGAATPFDPPATPARFPHLGDYLSAPLGRPGQRKVKTYLAGSKALDSLAKLILSTEHFFHPSNSGAWTADLSAFIKYVTYEFNKRWCQEQKPDCKTPKHRRLTVEMRRELVKCLRTVALLAMFSRDNTTVVNIQSALKSMTVMEPDLVLPPILERAIPSLEALTETHRTIAVIKALGAVALAIVSRKNYYAGAKYLLTILELLIPGIDLNDPAKTLCTTAFLVEISQYIKFGDLSEIHVDGVIDETGDGRVAPAFNAADTRPTMKLNPEESFESQFSAEEEDALVRESTQGFADWVTSFFRRVILLMENLPEEGNMGGRAGGEVEVQVIDSVSGACSQICVHLSEPLFDLVLNLIYDYASTTVRPNAVRAIHQLVECVANANPAKTLAKFVPLCTRTIRVELDNGASSLRTTSTSSPLPSDATLHWNLAVLRGAMYNDGKAIMKHRAELLPLLQHLHQKTLSKRGFSWTGKLLCSILLTLTHTYPLENRFVNPDEWNSEEFQYNHHLHWGKLYSAEDVKVTWHVPDADEIAFAIEILDTVVAPALDTLEGLLDTISTTPPTVWRNDFCRHLSLVRYGFSGIPTFLKEHISDEEYRRSFDTTDILNELPEFIATVDPIESGFILTDPDDPRYKTVHALRQRFGTFLHRASTRLLSQGEENTVDAVQMLIRSIRTFMFEYGDNRDSYTVQRDQYFQELSLARQYAEQKVWPRALFVRKARLYHSARLRWNSVERLRSKLEDSLIDDIAEWSVWHYAGVRSASQAVLESLCSTFDGCRVRCLPKLYKALDITVDDDRMKGALYTLNSPSFAKFAMSEPSLTNEFVTRLFACQHKEKPSIRDCMATIWENCLSIFVEPSDLVYSVPQAHIDKAISELEAVLPASMQDRDLVQRLTANREKRTAIHNAALLDLTRSITAVANSPKTHWRYSIVALRLLRTLLRRDRSSEAAHIKYMVESVVNDHPSMRYYAQRCVMKLTRYIKLRTYSGSTLNLALQQSVNPLLRHIPIPNPTHEFTSRYLASFRVPVDGASAGEEVLFQDKPGAGWIAWQSEMACFASPAKDKSTFLPWEPSSEVMLSTLREVVIREQFWERLSEHYAEENNQETTTLDNISCVKSIFQVLEDECLPLVKPILEKLLANIEQNKQRAGAELLAGILGGSKHWPLSKQNQLWDWLTPMLPKVLGSNVKTDTLDIWTSFLEYVFGNRDPRRSQPLVDYVVEQGLITDYNGESSFEASRSASFWRALAEELGWRFAAWTDQYVERHWAELASEHEEVRAYVADALEISGKIKWQPKPSIPTVEVFVKECRTRGHDADILGIRNGYHVKRIAELVIKFPEWREQRLPGTRAFQSTYDRVGVTVCKWLFQAFHDVQAVCTFDYILPLMPELFRFTEVNDNDELAARASLVLVRMCGVTPPTALVNPLIDAMFDAIRKAASWKVRMKALPLLQVFYFRQFTLISDEKVSEILEIICGCLDNEIVEVREMAATTLSGILRCSPKRSVLMLKERFERVEREVRLPPRGSPDYLPALRKLHSAILGVKALIEAFPYSVPHWCPDLIMNVLSRHTYDPIPISTTVRNCASSFKKTHQDTWHEDQQHFNEEQMQALGTLLSGTSYYA
ncbi:hypothetical protein AURDEDRAFT_109790 [Auricularia subglabra TFB-10046 SS5]|nr:hypothetical protein AURDEDRAFT_109790 [Auricularia subglabra TFB-10046 SS5]